MKKTIAVLPGDGIGPEIIRESLNILRAIEIKYNHRFIIKEALIGAAAIDKKGDPYPNETHAVCLDSDAILFGAIGDPRYDNNPVAKIRPEQGLLTMRKSLQLYANIRPIFTFPNFISKSPLKPEIVNGVNFVVVRELIGGIYFGKQGRGKDGLSAFDTCEYTKEEIRRVVAYAYILAGKRRKKLTIVDKANVLETSRLWRETAQAMMKEYPDINTRFMFVDNAAMQIIKKPNDFDVIVTENMFGDILTDEASVITGSIGMLPSASIGSKTSLYEPIHGSFPSAVGKHIANPIGSILSVAMMLDFSFGLKKESNVIFKAVESVVTQGYGTKDIAEVKKIISPEKLTQRIISYIEQI